MCEKISHGTRILLVEAFIKGKVDQWVTFDDLRSYFLTTHEIHVPDSYLTSPTNHVAQTYPQYVIKRGTRIMWETAEGRAARLANEEDEEIHKEVASIHKLRKEYADLMRQAADTLQKINQAEDALLTKRGEKGFQAAVKAA